MPANDLIITGKIEGINLRTEQLALAGLCSHDRETQGSSSDMQVTDAGGESFLVMLRKINHTPLSQKKCPYSGSSLLPFLMKNPLKMFFSGLNLAQNLSTDSVQHIS